MTVKAIWERPQAHKRYGGVFCLMEDGRFLHLVQEKEDDGTDKDGEYKYIETGYPEFSNAFNAEYHFDFQKADYFIKHFGGVLVYKEGVE